VREAQQSLCPAPFRVQTSKFGLCVRRAAALLKQNKNSPAPSSYMRLCPPGYQVSPVESAREHARLLTPDAPLRRIAPAGCSFYPPRLSGEAALPEPGSALCAAPAGQRHFTKVCFCGRRSGRCGTRHAGRRGRAQARRRGGAAAAGFAQGAGYRGDRRAARAGGRGGSSPCLLHCCLLQRPHSSRRARPPLPAQHVLRRTNVVRGLLARRCGRPIGRRRPARAHACSGAGCGLGVCDYAQTTADYMSDG